jgi:methyl-accepting chemotaxis protein
VKNLKLAHKMLVLTLILMVSLLVVAYVAVDRLSVVNAEIQQLVDQTMKKGETLGKLHVDFLSSVRAQKNAIMSPDDEISKINADLSEAAITSAESHLKELTQQLGRNPSDLQSTEMDELSESMDEYGKLNDEALKLSVENTNSKARNLLSGDIQREVDMLAARFQSWIEQAAAKTEPKAEDLERMEAITSILRTTLEVGPNLLKHIDSSSIDELTGQETKLAAMQEQILEGLDKASGGDPAGQVEARATLAEMKGTITKLLQFSRLDTNSKSTTISLTTAKSVVDEVTKRVDALDKLFETEASAGKERSSVAYETARWWIISVSLISIVVVGFIAYLVTRSVTGPVFEVRNMAQSMANGDLRNRIHLEQKDEVGELSAATNMLADSLTRIVTEIQKVSEGLGVSASELTGVSNQLLSQSETASLKATSVAGSSEQLSSNINTMAAAAEQMSVNVASISSASEEMSINVGTISTAAEQTSTNVSVVSTAVGEISDSFNDVLNDVREGSRVAGEASRMADSATQTIELLNQSGAEISKVTETIKMIALQTNLLALNATIEATSAGEAGKGFAVVAHEIKELANQSAKAAEDIARKIEGVQKDTRQAVQVIQNVSQIIKDINSSSDRISLSVEKQTRSATMISQNVGEANKGVSDIARSIAEVAKAAGDMSRNVSEAARGATDVSRNVGEAAKAAGGISSSIHGVSEASHSTNKSATKVHDSAEHLDRISRDLRKLVGKFKVNTEEVDNA